MHFHGTATIAAAERRHGYSPHRNKTVFHMLREAFAHIENGRYREAEQACRALLAADAGDAAANTLLALSLQAQQQLDEAIALFRRLAAAPGAGFEASSNLGNALREAGRNDEAEAALREALQRGGEHAGVLLNLGLNALDAGDAMTALGWLERALRQAPLDAEIRTYAAAAAFEPAISAAHANC